MKHNLLSLLLATTAILCSVSCSSYEKQELSATEADSIALETWNNQSEEYTAKIAQSWSNEILESGDYEMPFWYSIKGEAPEYGYPMYISMHGGGGTTKELNDKQWENQKRLYGEVDGVYLAPRAPTNSWNLWHRDYMDDFLLQTITYAVRELNVNPNRIYLLGYSAGGDGTFNLAPRLSDRFAAAAMMAGHPGDAEAENLRNIPFAIYMGALDSAYNRNGLAQEWSDRLGALQENDPKGYTHRVVIYPNKGHWMDNEDKEAIDWLATFTRNPYPQHIIWVQDDVLATRKYNLQVTNPKQGDRLVVSYDKKTNSVTIEESDYDGVTIWLNDSMLDLDSPVTIYYQGDEIFNGIAKRTEENITQSIEGRYDPSYAFSAKVEVDL